MRGSVLKDISGGVIEKRNTYAINMLLKQVNGLVHHGCHLLNKERVFNKATALRSGLHGWGLDLDHGKDGREHPVSNQSESRKPGQV